MEPLKELPEDHAQEGGEVHEKTPLEEAEEAAAQASADPNHITPMDGQGHVVPEVEKPNPRYTRVHKPDGEPVDVLQAAREAKEKPGYGEGPDGYKRPQNKGDKMRWVVASLSFLSSVDTQLRVQAKSALQVQIPPQLGRLLKGMAAFVVLCCPTFPFYSSGLTMQAMERLEISRRVRWMRGWREYLATLFIPLHVSTTAVRRTPMGIRPLLPLVTPRILASKRIAADSHRGRDNAEHDGCGEQACSHKNTVRIVARFDQLGFQNQRQAAVGLDIRATTADTSIRGCSCVGIKENAYSN